MDRTAAREFADEWVRRQGARCTTIAFAQEIGVSVSNLFHKRRKVEKLLNIQLPTMLGSTAVAARERMKTAFKVTSKLPSEVRDFQELLADRKRATRRRLTADSARELIEIQLDISGPFAIAMIGDPHIDNPGCNLELLMKHTETIVGAEGMFAICVGDVQDNWIGRLSRLWATQGISAAESQVLVNGWLTTLAPKLIALCAGNHDVWAESMSGMGPLDWIRAGGAVMERHGVRMRLSTRDRQQVTINMRHDFPGRSQYNAAHGPNKSLMFGFRDDVAVAGHTHEFGRGVRLDPATRKPMHAIRLGSYKHADEYARQLGMLDNNVTECSVLMVDPGEIDLRHRTWVEDNPFRAARMLNMLRNSWSKRRDRAGKG